MEKEILESKEKEPTKENTFTEKEQKEWNLLIQVLKGSKKNA